MAFWNWFVTPASRAQHDDAVVARAVAAARQAASEEYVSAMEKAGESNAVAVSRAQSMELDRLRSQIAAAALEEEPVGDAAGRPLSSVFRWWNNARTVTSEYLERAVGSQQNNAPAYAMNHPQQWRDQTDPRMRPYRMVTVDTLRALAENYDILGACLAHLKDQVIKTPLRFVPKDPDDKSEETKRQIAEAKEFFDTPGGIGGPGKTRATFEGEWLDDLLVIGQAAVWFDHKTRGSLRDKNPDAVISIDASTIQPLITPYGFEPDDNAFAYRQVVQGVPMAAFKRDELFYEGLPIYVKTHSPYPMSMVELLVMVVFTALKSDEWNRTWLTDGNVPDMWMKLPETMTPVQAKEWMKMFNQMLRGNSKQRHQVKVTPGEITGRQGRKDSDFQEFDYWLMGRTCTVTGVNPASIGQHSRQYKDSQESAMASTRDNRVETIVMFRKALYDLICRRKGWTNIETASEEPGETEKKARADRNKIEIESGQKSPNECRREAGEEPYEGGDTYFVSSTVVPIQAAIANATQPQPAPGPVAPDAVSKKPAGAPAPEAVERSEHKFSCVMAPLNADDAAKLRDWGLNSIRGESLSPEGGFVEDSHITVRYGLHTSDAGAVSRIFDDWCFAREAMSLRATVGNFALFHDKQGEYDVLVLEVESEDLHSLNAWLGALEHTDTFPEYKPHITVAYVRPGAADHFEGKPGPLTGATLALDSLVFSAADGRTTRIENDGDATYQEELARVLKLWRRKALRRLAGGESAGCAFTTDILSREAVSQVRADLSRCTTREQVSGVFALVGEALARGAKDQPRGKTTDKTNSGSFAPAGHGGKALSADELKHRAFWGTSQRDAETKRLFNGDVSVNVLHPEEVNDISTDYFGRTLDAPEWGQLVGAPDGSHVAVRAFNHYKIDIRIEHDEYIRNYAIRQVHPGDHRTEKDAYIENVVFVKGSEAPERLAPRMLAYEFKKAAELGMDTVTLEAAGEGGSGSGWTGYSRWPQLGFNADLTGREMDMLPDDLAGAEDLHSLMALPGGFEWWKENGSGREMFFDLTPGSESLKVFNKYLDDKGIKI